MYKLKSLQEHINEAIATREIDITEFPNPDDKPDKEFFIRGKKDGNLTDDIVVTKKASIPAKSLKPSQNEVFLGKALGLAISGVEGGNLQAIISSDNRILDGHHRWASTIFNNPKAKIIGAKADLKIGDLIPVLRSAGDAMGNTRGFEPAGGDLNIFNAKIEDIEDAIYNGTYMDTQYYNRQEAAAWYENIGKDVISKRLAMIQRFGPPEGAPSRPNMPKIHPAQVNKVSKSLTGGKIDLREPYI